MKNNNRHKEILNKIEKFFKNEAVIERARARKSALLEEVRMACSHPAEMTVEGIDPQRRSPNIRLCRVCLLEEEEGEFEKLRAGRRISMIELFQYRGTLLKPKLLKETLADLATILKPKGG